jgi:arabinan endo-1,5-alpha-L-arabinosidase
MMEVSVMGFRKRWGTWTRAGVWALTPIWLACQESSALYALDPYTSGGGDHPGSEPAEAGATPALELSGDLRAHDPALVRSASGWYVFSTGDPNVAGGTLQIRRSSNARQWEWSGTVFEEIPEWVREAVPGVQNLWAPDVIEHDGQYLLYYSASTFGSNRSVIGFATNATLDPDDANYQWVDRGLLAGSLPENDYNAIDPSVIVAAGRVWLAFGSFWSGIRMLELTWPGGAAAAESGEPLRLADRFVPPNAVEAPTLVQRGDWYYLFVSFDFCCQGLGSTYKIAVGRSREVTGPYHDRLGTPLAHGGGTVILSERGDMFGPGGQSVHGGLLAHHYYDRSADGDFRLGLRRITWDASGWPHVADDE